MSRNQERVLSDAMITDIKAQLFGQLEWNDNRNDLINALMNAYLTDDFGSFKEFITEVIESYESDIILTLNMQLNEDSHDNN